MHRSALVLCFAALLAGACILAAEATPSGTRLPAGKVHFVRTEPTPQEAWDCDVLAEGGMVEDWPIPMPKHSLPYDKGTGLYTVQITGPGGAVSVYSLRCRDNQPPTEPREGTWELYLGTNPNNPPIARGTWVAPPATPPAPR